VLDRIWELSSKSFFVPSIQLVSICSLYHMFFYYNLSSQISPGNNIILSQQIPNEKKRFEFKILYFTKSLNQCIQNEIQKLLFWKRSTNWSTYNSNVYTCTQHATFIKQTKKHYNDNHILAVTQRCIFIKNKMYKEYLIIL
jgi:hypothetical protein